jgi:hypothetical protein
MTDPARATPETDHTKPSVADTQAIANGWPACATYPNLGCVCRGALTANASTCTRKRTGYLTPVTPAVVVIPPASITPEEA